MNVLRTTSLLLFLFVSSASFAQTEKGGFLVSGSLSLSAGTTKYGSGNKSKYVSYSISPKVGYFLIDRLVAGLSLPVDWSKAESDDSGLDGSESRSAGIGVGPFVRYYIPMNDKIFMITHLGYAYSKGKTIFKDSDSESEYETKSNRFDIAAGVCYFANKNVGVEGLINYQRLKQEDMLLEYSTVSLQVGLQIYFSR